MRVSRPLAYPLRTSITEFADVRRYFVPGKVPETDKESTIGYLHSGRRADKLEQRYHWRRLQCPNQLCASALVGEIH